MIISPTPIAAAKTTPGRVAPTACSGVCAAAAARGCGPNAAPTCALRESGLLARLEALRARADRFHA